MLVTRQLQRIERKAIYKPEKIMCSQVTSFNISPEHSKQDKHQVGRFQHKRPKETQAYNSHRGGKSEIKASNSRAIAADKIPCANLGDKPSSFTRTSNPPTSLLYLNPPLFKCKLLTIFTHSGSTSFQLAPPKNLFGFFL